MHSEDMTFIENNYYYTKVSLYKMYKIVSQNSNILYTSNF